MPVHDRVQQHARKYPQSVAINIDGQTLSWQQLWRRSQALYQYILTQPTAGNPVAIATGNAIAFPIAWLAATAQPFTAAIVDPQLPAAQLHEMLSRIKPGLLLLNQQDRATIALADALQIRWLAVDRWLENDPVNADDLPAFSQGMHDATPFLINFTSGTTSLPKAFVRSRRSWRSSFENGEAIFQLTDAPSTLFPGPLSNGIGLYCLNETLYAGGCFYSLGKWQPDGALALIARQQIQRLVVVPTMIAGFARVADGQLFPGLLNLLSAGSKLELNHYRQARALFPEAQIQEYYGASELGFVAVSTLNDDSISDSLATVGQAFPGTTIEILDDDGAPVAVNQPGRIFIRSEQIIEGYLWGDDGSAFKKYAWGATVSDIGYLDERQNLHIIGRRGNMIVSGGNNIYLSEIETTIKSIRGVIEAVVIAIDDNYLGKKIVAMIDAELSLAETIPLICREQLAKYKLPRHYYHISRWPLTPAGKIKRAELEIRIANHDFRTDLTELPAGR
ncbi:class I adenylate-forming enzyme family protein [Erwinia sp. JUb26]|uniref:class I adenylate-forming enzyme family protein n=1 Tax=Erwinia sp. JUb26 TaxID=2485126 RepID=UPI000F4A8594|nr:class I adenylate-forming enzyme family protein [Erwinia sp. JUb26]ROR05121.1 acyl-CoA synthetase (AMP-forming)/AMP-acid ligase II [Erwinia sp. JUb26]